MKRSKTKSKRILKISVLVVIYVFIFVVVDFVGADSIFGIVFGDMKSSWINNTPVLSYEENKDNKNEAVKPVIGEQYGVVSCESIGLKAPLYLGDSMSIFEVGAGTSNKFVLPGEKGISLIGGHDTTFFKPLENVKSGDKLIIDTTYGNYTYVVTETKVEKVYEFKYDNNNDESTVILYTCYPFGEITSNREERFYVYAKKQ